MLVSIERTIDRQDGVVESSPARASLVQRVVDRMQWEWREFRRPSRATFSQEELDRALLDEVDWPAGDRVLDVGCAKGAYLAAIADKGTRVIGIDLSLKSLGMVRDAGHAALQASGDCLPFGDGTFDTILCHKTMHLFRSPDVTVREFCRVLAEGGRVLMSTSNATSPYARVQAASLARGTHPNWGYANRWTVSDWGRAFAGVGMATRTIYSCNLVWPLVYRVCDQWLIPNEWMRRYSRWVRRTTGIPLRTSHPIGLAQDYLVEFVKHTKGNSPGTPKVAARRNGIPDA